MHILVTNDDGVTYPGLHALVGAMQQIGEVTVLAPDRNWSASGHVKTLHRPLRLKQTELPDGTPAWASDGAPSDCIALAALGFIEKKIDLVVSGINPYANLAEDVTYSGTVTAAMEAAISGLPGVAFSLDTPTDFPGKKDFTAAAAIAQRVVEQVIKNDLPHNSLLNVNIPHLPLDQIKGMRITRMGLRVYRNELVRRVDPFGRPYYWIGGESPAGNPDEGTDIGALSDGYVSITPIHLDMTAHDLMAEVATWWGLDAK
ncbi:MAG: 5'/3'-nucleotidase SurE [Chloroflexi bacterium]|nr:5'/3'-nucleotidase SurE [Chloroflexota bacterium]